MRTHRQTALPSGVTSFAKALVGRAMRFDARGCARRGDRGRRRRRRPARSSRRSSSRAMPSSPATPASSAYPAPSGGRSLRLPDRSTRNGPSARVVDLTNPGPQGVVSPAPKPFTVTAAQVGQVFGVALDNAPQPNIYLAATSAYGLSIYLPDRVRPARSASVRARPARSSCRASSDRRSSAAARARSGGSPASPARSRCSAPIGTGSLGQPRRPRLRSGDASRYSPPSAAPASSIASASTASSGAPTTTASRDGRAPVWRRCRWRMPLPVDINSPAFSTENPATLGLRRAGAARLRARRPQQAPLLLDRAGSADLVGRHRAERLDSGQRRAPRGRGAVARRRRRDHVDRVRRPGPHVPCRARQRRPATTILYSLANDGQSRVLRYLPKPPGDPAPGRWRLDARAVFDRPAAGLQQRRRRRCAQLRLRPDRPDQSRRLRRRPSGRPASACSIPATARRPSTFPTVDGLQGNADRPRPAAEHAADRRAGSSTTTTSPAHCELPRLHGRRRHDSVRRRRAAATAATAAAGQLPAGHLLLQRPVPDLSRPARPARST